ncbi:hypothetical protein [Candidatus Pantoea edessiphila]|uniref:hypothetical protein n=1 Tax=Candidatus Pantoea edessiphila TaxID=2044610 RepID=UPI00109BF5BA|nr:hypothetical protein [Candidatus Pantoea edessiphila]
MLFIQDDITNGLSDYNLKPIVLIFDSGIGGISVYKEIKKKIPIFIIFTSLIMIASLMGIKMIYSFLNVLLILLKQYRKNI